MSVESLFLDLWIKTEIQTCIIIAKWAHVGTLILGIKREEKYSE